MPLEKRADPLDPDDRALAESSGAVMLLHALTHGPPLSRLDTAGDAPVGDDFHYPIGHQHVDKDPVVVLRVPDAELPKKLPGAPARCQIVPKLGQIESRLHHEADLPAMARLAFADRLLDRMPHGRRKVTPRAPTRGEDVPSEAPQLHARSLPASRGTAATTTTTTESSAKPAPASSESACSRVARPSASTGHSCDHGENEGHDRGDTGEKKHVGYEPHQYSGHAGGQRRADRATEYRPQHR